MVVREILKWIGDARVAERATAAAALARAFLSGRLPFEDRCATEAALTVLLDDPSSKVRAAMAEALSMSRHAPPHLIAALAADQPEVAAFVIGRSPLLTDADLIERVVAGTAAQQRLVAGRASVSMAVAAAIAEIGEAEACVELAGNPGAEIASVSFRRMTERHGDRPEMREALAAHPHLPADCRHTLLVKLGASLKSAPLVVALIGAARAEKVAREACVGASITLVERTPADEHVALVEHLRLAGELSAGFLIRAVAHGKIDFFGAALSALTGQARERVTALLAAGHDLAVIALFRKAGLSSATHRALLRGVKLWRDVAAERRVAGIQEIAWLMLQEVGEEERGLAALLKSLHLEAVRDNARRHALAITAA